MTWRHFDGSTDNAYLAHFARRLSDLIIAQGDEMLAQHRLRTPASSVSTVLFLWKAKKATVTELSDAFSYTHQMAAQRIKGLEDIGLVKRIANESDRRSRLIALTQNGAKEAEQLAIITKNAAVAIEHLFKELNVNLTAKILEAEQCLQKASLAERMKNRKRYSGK